MLTRQLVALATLGLTASCGGRSSLLVGEPRLDAGAGSDGPHASRASDGPSEAGESTGTAGHDAGIDAPVDASRGSDAGGCEDDDNTTTPATECSSPSGQWFAFPYTPTLEITVDRVELHTTAAQVALLASSGGAPGQVLFTGSTATSATPDWLPVDLPSPLPLQIGAQYFLAEKTAYCSFATGGTPTVEYEADAVTGPWSVSGKGLLTARVHGSCGCRLCAHIP